MQSISRRRLLTRSAAAGVGFGFLPCLHALAADGDFQAVTDFIQSKIDAGVMPGASLQINRGGKTLVSDARGSYCSATEFEQPMSADVVMPLYSFSKVVSATVIAMLVADGALDYNAPVKRYLPKFTGGGKDPITLRHMLTHSSGLPVVPLKAVNDQAKWDAAVTAMCDASVDWEPGSRSVYHGLTGLFTAAACACAATGENWETLCRTRLFEPLGTASMTFAPPSSGPVALVPRPPQEVLGNLQGSAAIFYNLAGFTGHPAGGCFATLDDMIRVIRLHNQGGKWEGKQLIDPAVHAEMHRVQYADEIAAHVAAGKTPAHQSWGLGPLMRGSGPSDGSHAWFGFRDQQEPAIFGHAGISTVIGVGDPTRDLAIAFATMDAPKPENQAVEVRNGVVNRVYSAL